MNIRQIFIKSGRRVSEKMEEKKWEAPSSARIHKSKCDSPSAHPCSSGARHYVWLTLSIIFLGVVVYVVVFSFFMRIDEIDIYGNEVIVTKDIEKVARDEMDRLRWHVLPSHNLLALDISQISQNLRGSSKRIKSVEISRLFPNRLRVDIQEHHSIAIWITQEKSYVLNEDGLAYKLADFNSEEVADNNLTIIHDLSERDVSVGEMVFPQPYLDFALSIRDRIRNDVGIETEEGMDVPSRAAEELILKSTEGWKIYLSSRTPIDNSIETLKLVFSREIKPEARQFLEYIDARSENKVFYKFIQKDDEGSSMKQDNLTDEKEKK